MTATVMLDETEVPEWMFDILIDLDASPGEGGCCGWDGDPEGRRDRDCIVCAAWEHGQEMYYAGWYGRRGRDWNIEVADPERYAAEMRDAGRGHLVRGLA